MSLLDAMVKIRKANVILRVPRDEAEKYKSKGFEVITDEGEILEHSTAMDLNSLKVAYNSALKEIEELKAELAKFKKPVKVEEEEPVQEEVTEEPKEEEVVEESEEEVLEKPTKKATRKKSTK